MENIDIEKLALELYPPRIDAYMEGVIDWNLNIRKAYIESHKQKKEPVKKYTDDDIAYIRNMLMEGALTNMSCASAIVGLDRYINMINSYNL